MFWSKSTASFITISFDHVLYSQVKNVYLIVLITLIFTSELTLIFVVNETLNMKFGDIVRLTALVHAPNIKNDNLQIRRGCTVNRYQVF